MPPIFRSTLKVPSPSMDHFVTCGWHETHPALLLLNSTTIGTPKTLSELSMVQESVDLVSELRWAMVGLGVVVATEVRVEVAAAVDVILTVVVTGKLPFCLPLPAPVDRHANCVTLWHKISAKSIS